MGYYSRNYFPVYQPRTYITASPLATLGAAFPQALGAKVALPERAVVATCGDGGFLYNAQELATAVKEGINVVVIVFNDNAYGNVLGAGRAVRRAHHRHAVAQPRLCQTGRSLRGHGGACKRWRSVVYCIIHSHRQQQAV